MPEKFINIDRDTPMFLPPDLRDWVPEGHLVHFVLEVVNSLELSSFTTNVRGTGSAQYDVSLTTVLAFKNKTRINQIFEGHSYGR